MFTLNSPQNLTIQSKPIVKIQTNINIIGTNTKLPIEVTADFTNIPTDLHEMYLQSFQYQYIGDVNVYNHIGKKSLTNKTQQKERKVNKIVDTILNSFKFVKRRK